MSENKFIKRLKGEQTAKSVLEIKNESAKTSFANMPKGTSNAINVYSDHRGNATAVLEGAEIWKLNNSQFSVVPNAFGDGRDFTSTYTVFGSSLWVNATHTFDQPKIFTGATQWTLKLCGHSLLSSLSNTIGFSLIIKFGNAVTITKSFSVSESAFEFCKEFIIDFSESEQSAIKVVAGDTMTVQLLCADATASATIYNGMTTLVAQQRRVDGEAVASNLYTFEDLEVEIAEIQDDIEGIQSDIEGIQSDIEGINGKIIVRSATIPTASAGLVGKAYQYAGTTNGQYTHNYIYECVAGETTYSWVRVDVQPDRIAQIQALQADITDIQALIPAQASPTNQLGDKNFINSSIATNTANFIGTFNSVAELEAYSGTVTNNDYAFVTGTDSAGNTTYNRYKYNANTQQWIYEYTLNNSSFTADQWTAINSGVTASDVSKARSAVQPSDLGNGTITITQGGTTMGSFTTNQSSDQTIALDSGGYHPNLFDVKWADHELDDMQWLRADNFSWQDGGVYSNAYQHLVDDYDAIERVNVRDVSFSGGTVYYYRDSTKDSVGSSYPYAYTSYLASTIETIYCDSETAYMGETFYTTPLGTITYGTATGAGTQSIRVPKTETISGITIAYYEADDKHKIILASQVSNAMLIYDATGVAWYYVLDTTNERFILPRTKFGFTGLRDTVGKYVEPGLPNITGLISMINPAPNDYRSRFTAGSGALKGTGTYSAGRSPSTSETGNGYPNASLDASWSNSIYGNSTTVQAPATQMYLYFYVGSFTQTAIENTAGLNAELFNDKADVDLSNANATAKANVVTWGMPDYNSGISFSNNTDYTAPKDGFIIASGYSSTSASSKLYLNNTQIGTFVYNTSAFLPAIVNMPINKGDIIKINFTGALSYANFYPLKGAQ